MKTPAPINQNSRTLTKTTIGPEAPKGPPGGEPQTCKPKLLNP